MSQRADCVALDVSIPDVMYAAALRSLDPAGRAEGGTMAERLADAIERFCVCGASVSADGHEVSLCGMTRRWDREKETFLCGLAPFVMRRCVAVFVARDGDAWRYRFDGVGGVEVQLLDLLGDGGWE